MNASVNPGLEPIARAALRAETPRFVRDALGVALAVLALTASAIFALYFSVVESAQKEEHSQLLSQAKYLASLVDMRVHSWLVSPQQTDTPQHQALTERLQRFRTFYPGMERLFTGRYQNGQIFLILDTYDPQRGPTIKHSVLRPLGIGVTPDMAEIQAIRKNEPLITEEPLFEPQGDFLGVLYPLGGASDFLYVDVKKNQAGDRVAFIRKVRDIALILSALMSAIAGALFFSWRCQAFLRQKRAEAALRQNEELFRSTFELSPVAMCLVTPQHRITQANKAFREFLGYDETHLRKLKLEEYTHPEDLAAERKLLQEIQDRLIAQFQLEKRYLRKDKSIVWGLLSVAVVRDAEGVVSHYMAQVVDITERKLAEESLRLSEERLGQAVDAGNVGIWDYSVGTRQMVWNPVMHEIFRTDANGSNPTFDQYLGYIHSEDRSAIVSEFESSLRTGQPFVKEFRVVLDDGSIRHIRANAMVFLGENGRAIRAVGTNIDITAEKEESAELKRAKEEAQAADRAKSEFIGMMSHELRTPMNGVLGFLPLLKSTPLDDEQSNYVETIEASGQHLLLLIDDILDLSKIEAGQMQIQPEIFEIRPFIEDLYLLLKEAADEKRLRYTYAIAADVPEMIHTDRARLGQVLYNIVGNAVKFTERGEVKLQVDARPADASRQYWQWQFSVRDTGPGIGADMLPKIFKPFFQADSSATRRHGGTGLGLTIARSLAKLLGGDIEPHSWLGTGSEFILTLHLPSGESAEYTSPQAPVNRTGVFTPSLQGKRILVVEDNAINWKLCDLQLRRMGCVTDHAENGHQAVEKCRTQKYDAVLMDMQLPDLDGCSATREIRKQSPSSITPRIIALTANALAEDRIKCIEAGMDDYMCKPLKFHILAETLARWL